MKKFVFLCSALCGMFLFFGCTSNNKNNENISEVAEFISDKNISIVAFGDSLTEGYKLKNPTRDSYPAQLEKKLQTDGYSVEIENAGIAGETSSGAYERANWIAESSPDIILLFTGANDMLRGIAPSVVKNNIEGIVDIFQSKNITVILLPMMAQTALGEIYQKEFDALYFEIAMQKKIPIAPFPLQGVAFVPELNLDDGIHPNAKGYAIFIQNIYSTIEESL